MPPEKRDLIFTFAYVTWETAQRRGMNHCQDRLLETLLSSPRVGRLLVAEPFRSAPVRAVRAPLGRWAEGFPESDRVHLISPSALRRRDPGSVNGVARRYRAYGRVLRRAADRFGLDRPALIAMHPLVAGFASLDWAGPVTFYATDDWASHPAYGRWSQPYEAAYDRLREAGHAICAVSEPLLDRLEPTGPGIVVKNGIEPVEWLATGDQPTWMRKLPRPLFLYVGSLDNRIAVNKVLSVARAFPGGSVVLMGALMAPDHLAPLRECPNVHFRPWAPREEVTRVISAADVCLLPHLETPLTRCMSPLKLYEYLAGGVPVATVDLPAVHGVSDSVVVENGEGFPAAAATALRMGRTSEPERRRFIENHSWHERHETVLDLALRDPGLPFDSTSSGEA